MFAMPVVAGVLLAVGGVEAQSESPAELLDRVVHERRSIRTCNIVYRYERASSSDRSSRVGHYALTLAANGDRKCVDLGDDEGVTLRDEHGNPHAVWGREVRAFVRDSGRIWMREDQRRIVAFPPERLNVTLADPRTIGLASAMSFAELSDVMSPAKFGQNPRWRLGREGELICVSLVVDDASIKRWIDPTRGWNLVRIEYQRGEEHRVAHIELRKFDDIWFPSVVRVLSGPKLDAVRETIQVVSAEFNRPDHPSDFTPADIGIDDGASVELWDNQNSVIERGVVQGDRFVSWTSLEDRVRARTDAQNGAEVLDPSRVREVLRKPESLWERYVRRHIATYRLGDDQQQRCWTILRDCQEAAQSHLNRKKAELDAVLRDIARNGSAAPPGRPEGRADELTARLDVLIEPINRIFETRLKPRLEALVTKAQRASTQPGR